jgi:RNA polymerase sigma factor (sigma-70 family)
MTTFTPGALAAAYNASRPVLSLDRESDAESVYSCEDPTGVAALSRLESRIAVRQMLAALEPRDEEVVRRLYGIDRDQETQREVAESLNISQPAVSKIHSAAVIRLRSLA